MPVPRSPQPNPIKQFLKQFLATIVAYITNPVLQGIAGLVGLVATVLAFGAWLEQTIGFAGLWTVSSIIVMGIIFYVAYSKRVWLAHALPWHAILQYGIYVGIFIGGILTGVAGTFAFSLVRQPTSKIQATESPTSIPLTPTPTLDNRDLFLSSDPVNGAENVPVTTTVKLQFNRWIYYYQDWDGTGFSITPPISFTVDISNQHSDIIDITSSTFFLNAK